MNCYAHVDADCFYVSSERLRAPWLESQPVAVLGNQGACVIALSYEMKAQGVEVAMPIWKAKQLSPDGMFIKRDFRWYGLLSRAMQEVLHRFTDSVEYYSIDESFLNLGQPPGDWQALAERVQHDMLLATGLPVSIGIANTRTLCKLGSKAKKPFGAFFIQEKEREAILHKTPLQKVNGIGRRLIKRAHKLKLFTALDFASSPRRFIKQHFHKPGETLWYELNGTAILPINPVKTERKVVSRGGSIWGHYNDPTYIWGFLTRNLERFLTCLWDENIEILKLKVMLRTSQGKYFEATEALPDYSNEQSILLMALKKAFRRAYHPNYKYCRVHIVGAPLRQGFPKQARLFHYQRAQSDPAIKKLKVDINKRFGLFTLRSASSQDCAEVFKDKVSDYEITDVPGKLLF